MELLIDFAFCSCIYFLHLIDPFIEQFHFFLEICLNTFILLLSAQIAYLLDFDFFDVEICLCVELYEETAQSRIGATFPYEPWSAEFFV